MRPIRDKYFLNFLPKTLQLIGLLVQFRCFLVNYVTASLDLAAGPLETNRWRQSSSVTDSTFRLFHLHSRLNQRYVSLRTVRTGLQHSSVPRQTPATFCSAELHACPCGAVRNECMSLFDYLWNWSDGLMLGDDLFLLRLPLARNYVDWL